MDIRPLAQDRSLFTRPDATPPGGPRRRWLAAGVSVVLHAAILTPLLLAHPSSPMALPPPIMEVALIEPAPPPPPPPPKPDKPTPKPEPAKAPVVAKPPPRLVRARKTPVPPNVTPIPASEEPSTEPGDEMSDAEVAGAATAGSGAGGGACNMPQRLQAALRRDPLARSAATQAHRGKAIIVWNGAWVRRQDQEGAGLAAVREAVMWEVAFAPEACRRQAVRGLVLISLDDHPGAPRIVLGSGAWRWSDLLFAPGIRPSAQR